jgi:O-antigen/teichoic acid export membrane protein
MPTTLLAARWLGASDFGRAQFIVLVYSYAALVRTGAFEGGVRSFVHRRSVGDLDGAIKDQNVGFTVDLIASVVPGLALAVAALFANDDLRVLGLLCAPLAAVTGTLAAYLAGLRTAREEFGHVARVNLVRAILVPTFVLGGIVIVGAPAVFIGPLLADGLSAVGYYVGPRKLGLHRDLDRPTARRLIRTGFPLGALAIVYWVYRLVGPSTVAASSTAAVLGLYTFAAAPVAVVSRAISGLQTVIMPGLWGEMTGHHRRWIGDGERLTILIALVGGAATNLVQAAVPPLVDVVASRFGAAVPLLEVLAMNILLLSVATVPSLVLDSQLVNRQSRHLMIWLAGLLVNLGANVIVLLLGRSVLAVAWNDLWVQALVVVAIFEAAAPYQRPEWDRRAVYLRLVAVVAGTAAIGLVLHGWSAGTGETADTLIRMGFRVGFVGAAWAVATFLLRGRLRTETT